VGRTIAWFIPSLHYEKSLRGNPGRSARFQDKVSSICGYHLDCGDPRDQFHYHWCNPLYRLENYVKETLQ